MPAKHKGVDAYVAGSAPAVAPLLRVLRAFIGQAMPGATEGLQYGVPVFANAQGVPVIYLFGSKDHVNFGFLRSGDLDDPDGILKGSGKPSKHIRIDPREPVDTAVLSPFVAQCQRISA